MAQASILSIIASEGYARAWVSADVPVVLNGNLWGGTWTTGVHWSGASKAFGATVPLEFDVDEAVMALEDWVNGIIDPANPDQVSLSDDVLLNVDPSSRNVIVLLDNDSSFITKASQVTELNLGYSRAAYSSGSGNLFLGAEAKLYLLRLSRFAARFGDITDSEDLFDAIDNADFNNEEGFGVDVGALWVADNYQLGLQWTNINEPEFNYPEVDISPFRDADLNTTPPFDEVNPTAENVAVFGAPNRP